MGQREGREDGLDVLFFFFFSPPFAPPPALTFWILGCMREGQGGIWLRAAVISWDSTAARALQMAMTDWITRSAFRGKSPCRQGEAEQSPGLRARAKLCPRGAGSKQGRGWGAVSAPSCTQETTKERNKCCPEPPRQLPSPPRSCHVKVFPPFPSSDADSEPHRDHKKVCSKRLLRSPGTREPLLLG